MRYTVTRAFTDIDETLRHIGDIVDLSVQRAADLRRQGFVGALADPAPSAAAHLLVTGHSGRATSREQNIAGLSSAIALAVALKATINAHYVDAAAHTTHVDDVNTLVASAPHDIASLIASVAELITSYVAHDDDAELGAAWAFHAGQEGGNHSLASVVAPVNLQECITRLTDIKAKYNAHDTDAVCHGAGGANQEATGDPGYGDTVRFVVPGAEAGDQVIWSILDSGTGTVTGVLASAGDGYVDFKFSADPQNDCIISYGVAR